MSIIDNYTRIEQEIQKIASSAGRDHEQIKIVAVSKTFPANIVQEAIDSGIMLLGENKIQEAKGKIQELNGKFSLHLVGHLQSNKAKDAVNLFDVIHSIDKLSTAEKVNNEAQKIGKIQKILIQVNTSGEETKSGVESEEAIDLCKEIMELCSIEVLGLMTIGPLTNDEHSIRGSFKMLKSLLDKINSKLEVKMRELSMGMSSDYAIAIEEGATMVRIGSVIFGQRNYS